MKENIFFELYSGEYICYLVEIKISIRKFIKWYVFFRKEESCIINVEVFFIGDVDICFFGFDYLLGSFLLMMCSSSGRNIRCLGIDRIYEGKGVLVEEYFLVKLVDFSF